jgi:CspA family cold shock protein
MQQRDFEIAQTMAQAWVQQRTDPNEVAKSLRYLTEHPNVQGFFRYLRTVVQEGQAVVRSGRSLDYYRQIDQVCRKHLAAYRDDPAKMAEVLGWAVRLMRYYRAEPDLQKPPAPSRPRSKVRPTTTPTTGRQRGTVKWFNAQKGYGFIQPDGGGKDIFVHVSGLVSGVSTLLDNQQVEFDVVIESKGPKAVQVRPVKQ